MKTTKPNTYPGMIFLRREDLGESDADGRGFTLIGFINDTDE